MSGHRGQLKTAILPPWKSIRWFFNVNARLNVSAHKWHLYLTTPFSSLYLWFKLIWSSNNFLLSKFWPQYLQTCSENEVRILVFEKILHCANKLTWWASVFILGILISCWTSITCHDKSLLLNQDLDWNSNYHQLDVFL